jgi:uncharacterized LabA/DUF88 family protein
MLSHGGVRPVTYLFIDAAHLQPNFVRATAAWCGASGELDIRKVSALFSAAKVFYYDCLDDSLHKDETPEQQATRIEMQESAFRRINALQNTHVRLGSVSGTGKRRRQKEVDILIAVEMMNHAVRQNMDRAVLITGDRDFTPLVETLVQFGLTVEVAGDLRSTSDVLAAAADYYRPLGLRLYHSWMADASQRGCEALPQFEAGGIEARGLTAGAQGQLGEFRCELYPTDMAYALFVMTSKNGSIHVRVPRNNLQRLKLFLELEHGDASWIPDAV